MEIKASKISRHVMLTTSFQVVHELDAHKTLTVSRIQLLNHSASGVLVRLCCVPAGEVASEQNAVLWDFDMPEREFLEFGDGDIIRGVTIQARASENNAVNLKVSGLEESSI